MANKYLHFPNNIIICKHNDFDTFVTCKNNNKIVNEKLYNWYTNNGSICNIDRNIPVSGFKINVDKGFTVEHKIYITDPRGFDVTICIDNLLNILKNCSYNINTGFEGEFVYGWNNSTLTLIPISSEEYKYSKNFDNTDKVKLSDLIPGKYYKFKDTKELLYLGKLLTINVEKSNNNNIYTYKDINVHIFKKQEKYNPYLQIKTTKKDIIEISGIQLTQEELNNEIVSYYKYKFNSTIITSPFKSITNIYPNTDNLLYDFDKAIEDANTEYKVWETPLGGYLTNNINERTNYELWLFNDDYTSVIHYYTYIQLELEGLSQSQYLHKYKRITDTVDEINNLITTFNENAERRVYVYPSTEYRISMNNIIEDSIVRRTTKKEIIPTIEFINQYKDTGKLYISYEQYMNNAKCFILKTDNDYKFKAIDRNE